MVGGSTFWCDCREGKTGQNGGNSSGVCLPVPQRKAHAVVESPILCRQNVIWLQTSQAPWGCVLEVTPSTDRSQCEWHTGESAVRRTPREKIHGNSKSVSRMSDFTGGIGFVGADLHGTLSSLGEDLTA